MMQSKFGNQFQRIYKNRKLLKFFVKTTNVFLSMGSSRLLSISLSIIFFTPQDDEGYCDLNVYAEFFFLFLHYLIRNYFLPFNKEGYCHHNMCMCVCLWKHVDEQNATSYSEKLTLLLSIGF